MAQMNRALNNHVETIFMFPAVENLYISSSLIKQVLTLGGDIGPFVPPSVAVRLRERVGSGIDERHDV
jgi:pantetheine-phosphate adenylyltransferase